MRLAYGNSVSQEFRSRVLEIVKGFGWTEEHASWLMACMAFESAGTFSPLIKNAAGSGATGLIQFMPRTAIGLGTTVENLAHMSAVEQLVWVARYFKPYAKRIHSLTDMYMAILLPSAIGKPDDHKLFTGGNAYRQNAALDANNDGAITKAEATGRVAATLWRGLQPPHVYEVKPKENDMPIPAIAGAILATVLPALTAKIPELSAILKAPGAAESPEVMERVSAVLVKTTGATNVQEAAERVQADPQTAAEVNSAIRASRADIMDMIERVNTIDQNNIKSAREYNTAEPMMVDTKWLKLKFIHVLSLAFMGFAGTFVTIHWASLTAELKGAVITLMVIAGWNGVKDYWMGSSEGSARKTEMLTGAK